MLHSMAIRLIHVHQLETFYLCYGVKCQSGVNWGHWGQSDRLLVSKNLVSTFFFLKLAKCLVSSFFLSFSQFASSSTCLIGSLPNLVRSMYGWMASKVMGLKFEPGSFGVTGVKKVILLKTLLLLQFISHGHVAHAYDHLDPRYKSYGSKKSKSSKGHLGSQGSKMSIFTA